MNIVFSLIFAVFAAVCAFFAPKRQFQMLQQNSYFVVRYFRWYKTDFKPKRLCLIIAAVFGAALCVCLPHLGTALRAVITVLLCIFLLCVAVRSVSLEKHSIKRLAVTARVKRMWTTEAVTVAALAVLSVTFDGYVGAVFGGLLFLFAALPEIPTVLSALVMKPVEKAISNYYISDAKKILRSQKNMKVIGITGSYGKTSTKFILGRILSEKYNTLVTPENYNTPMGIVLTVRRFLKPQTEIFVCEMGAKRKGDIKEDCLIADPDWGVITSVGPQHLDTFGSIETVASTKFELADHIAKKGGKMFLNTDNAYIAEKAEKIDAVTYGTEGGDCTASDISYSPCGLSVTLDCKGEHFTVRSRLLGRHNAVNIAAAAAVALELGMKPDEIIYAVSKLRPVEHRLELKSYINGATLIDDAYNSNPEGCLEAVRVLGCFDGFKKILVTPGLVELGEREYEANRRLGEEAAKHADIIVLVGKKRSVPLVDGIGSTEFPKENIHVVGSFKEAVTLFAPWCDKNTCLLFENDLPDNYLE